MVTLYPLSSGSSGNCFYLSAGESLGGLLIDAGISARRIRQSLWEASIDPAGLRGILITHDHVDHIAGLRVLDRLDIAGMRKLVYLFIGVSGVLTLVTHL